MTVRFGEWSKFFGLSFFSNKQASRAACFGFVAVALNIFLAFLFFLFGYFAADVVPMSFQYDNASNYNEFVQNAFSHGLELRIENNKAVCNEKVNSYISDEVYKKNGYDLIIDTRPSDMLIQFVQVGVKGEEEISYEEYRQLSDAQKNEYKVETYYTDSALVLTDEAVKTYENFFNANENIKSQYEELDKTSVDYREQLYYLFVKHYYSINSVLHGAKAPVLRDYYYKNYVSDGKAYYLYIFDDMLAGSFKTDGGMPKVFGGYFNKYKDGNVSDIHGFIKDVYYQTVGYTFNSYFLSAISLLPTIIFIPLILAFIMWGIGKAVKDAWVKAYGGCLKTVSSFVWVSALLTALTVFCLSWAISSRLLYSLIPVFFGGLLIIRIAIYCILSAVKSSKQSCREEKSNVIFGGNL